ncbi:MAG: bifunctional serine/threonine-protein kinase/formylglycine-generating enzyme family protein [Planctomycetota bacterium]
MTHLRYRQILEIVEAALDVPPEERAALVERLAEGDPILLADVRRALDADVPSNFVEPPGGTRSFPAEDFEGARLGDFLLAEEIGRGGMGIVYRAVQEGLGREAAVKVLPAIRRADGIALQRFEREAVSASKLQHDALVPVLALGIEPEQAWYAMPLVRGHDLQAELSAQDAGDGANCLLPRFGTEEYTAHVVREVAKLARGLQHAHEEGVIHRDVKPGNVMVDRGGRMLLTDFGLASLSEGRTLTATGAIQGTPHYMSPEQAEAVGRPVTHQSDVYSLGVVLFELLTRRKPFQGQNAAVVLRQITSGTHQRVRKLNEGVARDLETICDTAMALRPKDRYASAASFAEDLERFTRGEPIAARPMPGVQRAWRWARRRPWRVSAAAVVVTSSLVAWGTIAAERSRTAREAYLAPLQKLLATDDPGREVRKAAFLVQRGARPKGLDAAALEIDALARAEIERDANERIEETRRLLALALEPRQDDQYPEYGLEPDRLQLTRAVRSLAELSMTYPDIDGLAELQALAYVDVGISVPDSISRGVGGSAFAQRMDPFTDELSEPIELGPLPVSSQTLDPGHYRFTVELEDGRFAELERLVQHRRSALDLVAYPRSAAELEGLLVSIEPVDGRFPDGDDRPGMSFIPEEGVALEPYSIGRYEVSHELFIRYLEGTGAPVPGLWKRLGFDVQARRFAENEALVDFDYERWLRLPVTRIPYESIRGCVEWYGCRVPIALELHYAHRGQDQLLVPPGLPEPGAAPGPGELRANVDGAPLRVTQDEDPASTLLALSAALRPVDEVGADAGPFGLFHPYGNASEATSTFVRYLENDVLVHHPTQRYVLGGAWDVRASNYDLTAHNTAESAYAFFDKTLGVRFARSIRIP